MGQPVVHWEIASNNAERLHGFYTALFGWTVDSNNPMHYGMVDTGGQGGINGGIMQTQGGMPSWSLVVATLVGGSLAAGSANARPESAKTGWPTAK